MHESPYGCYFYRNFILLFPINLEKTMQKQYFYLDLSPIGMILLQKMTSQMGIYFHYMLTHCGMQMFLTILLQGSCLTISFLEQRNIQQSERYSWVGVYHFYTRPNQIIQRCIREDEILGVLEYFHDESCGGHFNERRKYHKALCMSYYWPIIF